MWWEDELKYLFAYCGYNGKTVNVREMQNVLGAS